MDYATTYSVGSVVQNVSIAQVIPLFESLWFSLFWEPNTVVYDPAFDILELTNYLLQYEKECRQIPPQRHNKNVMESKHRIISGSFPRLKHNTENDPKSNGSIGIQLCWCFLLMFVFSSLCMCLNIYVSLFVYMYVC